jgi:hypothetical protein
VAGPSGLAAAGINPARSAGPKRNPCQITNAAGQSLIGTAAHQSKKYLISLGKMVGAQGIEPWTSPV